MISKETEMAELSNLLNNDFKCNYLIIIDFLKQNRKPLNHYHKLDTKETDTFNISQYIYYDEYKEGKFEIFIYRKWEEEGDTVEDLLNKIKSKTKLILTEVIHEDDNKSKLVYSVPIESDIRIELPNDLEWM